MLDMSVQAGIINIFQELKETMDMTIVYVSHDISTVPYICDMTNVMYMGRVVESAATEQILTDPKHPYTRILINSVPVPSVEGQRDRTEIEGVPETPINISEGCRFRDRCPERMDICDVTPKFVDVNGDCQVACHLYYDDESIPEIK